MTKHEFKVRLFFLKRRFFFHNRVLCSALSEMKYYSSPRGNYRREIVQNLFESLGPVAHRSGKDDDTLFREVLFARDYYALRDKDYFHFGMDLSMGQEKRDYVCWYELLNYYEQLAKLGSKEVYDRKELTYELFHRFYGRELVYIASEEDQAEFETFFANHRQGIAKPEGSMGGEGIKMLALSEETTPDLLWESVRESCPFVLEELIQQAPEMNTIYPYSVNTIRYTTFFHEGKLTKMQATLRVGRDGNRVDNATQGGLFAPVDLETGRILSPARDYLCREYDHHPDTGSAFEGTYIPKWDELNRIIEEVVRIYPKQILVGWDFALSVKGWVMVEGNWNPGLQCFDPEHGLRKLVRETVGSVIPMWG